MAVLITGYSGFIGQHVLSRLVEQHGDIVCIGRKEPAGSGRGRGIDFLPVDLASGAGLDRVPWPRVQSVIHLASAGVRAAERNWPECVHLNILGTQRLLQCLERSPNLKTLVHCRTSYERSVTSTPSMWENPYVATKMAAYELVRLWSERRKVAMVFATIFQAFGPGDVSGNLLSYTVQQLRARKAVRLSSGRSMRDWIGVQDVSKALVSLAALQTPGTYEFDIGTGRLTSVREIVLTVARLLGADESLLEFSPDRDRNDCELRLCAERYPPAWQPSSTSLETLLSEYINS